MKKKLFVVFFSLFLLIGCTIGIVTNDKSVTNDIYYVPQNYEGPVFAFYNVEGAPEIKNEGDYQVHTVNDEGYFVTSTVDMDYGTVTDKYFYVDKEGNRTEINNECIRGMGTGSTENSTDSTVKYEIRYTGIEVTKNECGPEFRLSGNGISDEELDSVLAEVVKKYYGVERNLQ